MDNPYCSVCIWRVVPGAYEIRVSGSSASDLLTANVTIWLCWALKLEFRENTDSTLMCWPESPRIP